MYLMLRAFRLFLESSKLKTNVYKSSFCCCQMNENEILRIQNVFDTTREFLVWGPIYSNRISAAQCYRLVEKITTKIRVWIGVLKTFHTLGGFN